MDNLYLLSAFVALFFGVWIGRSGLRRWQERHQPATRAIEAQTSPLTNFRWRPQLELGFGLLLIGWALRIFVLFAVQHYSAQPEPERQTPAGRPRE